MFLNLFLFYQVVWPLGRKSVNKYLYLYFFTQKFSGQNIRQVVLRLPCDVCVSVTLERHQFNSVFTCCKSFCSLHRRFWTRVKL